MMYDDDQLLYPALTYDDSDRFGRIIVAVR